MTYMFTFPTGLNLVDFLFFFTKGVFNGAGQIIKHNGLLVTYGVCMTLLKAGLKLKLIFVALHFPGVRY